MKVAEVMTKDVIWLDADEPISLAAWTMAAEFITGAPVRDHTGKLVGVLSNTDVAREAAPSVNKKVSSLMSTSVVSITEDAPLVDAARLFAERSVHRIVVTDSSGAVVGVVTALDVLRGLHLSGILSATK